MPSLLIVFESTKYLPNTEVAHIAPWLRSVYSLQETGIMYFVLAD